MKTQKKLGSYHDYLGKYQIFSEGGIRSRLKEDKKNLRYFLHKNIVAMNSTNRTTITAMVTKTIGSFRYTTSSKVLEGAAWVKINQ